MSDDAFELPEPIGGPDKEANEAKLQEQLHKYQEALAQEFSDGVKYEEGKMTPVEIRTKTKELLTQAVPKAVARLLHIVEHGTNESNQIKAATYIIDKAVGKEVGGIVGDPLDDLINKLNPQT
jgi:hypothetical protein